MLTVIMVIPDSRRQKDAPQTPPPPATPRFSAACHKTQKPTDEARHEPDEIGNAREKSTMGVQFCSLGQLKFLRGLYKGKTIGPKAM